MLKRKQTRRREFTAQCHALTLRGAFRTDFLARSIFYEETFALLCRGGGRSLPSPLPAFAAPVVVENLGADPNTGISFFTPGAGLFDNAFTFSVTAPETLTIAAILNTFPQGPGSSAFISNFIGEIVMGTPATPGTIEVGPELATSLLAVPSPIVNRWVVKLTLGDRRLLP